MIKYSISYRFIFLWAVVMLHAGLSAQTGDVQPQYSVEVLAPFEVNASEQLEAEFIITKGDYRGPMLLRQTLPPGFALAGDHPENSTLDISGNEYIIGWKNLPASEIFRFTLVFDVSVLSFAVYPFTGHILIDGNRIGFSIPLTANQGSVALEPEVREENIPPVALFFEYPDLIEPGQSFTFVTTFVKDQNYIPGGELLQVWPDRFLPLQTNISNASFQIRGRLVMLNWEQMANEPEFSIAYQVTADTSAGGVYPVITEYHDSKGLQIQESSGIYVEHQTKKRTQATPKNENPLNIQIEIPDEIYSKDPVGFSCSFRPTGIESAELHIELPPGSILISCSVDNYEWDGESATAVCFWKTLPNENAIHVSGQIDVSKVKPAVYPVVVSVGGDHGRHVRKISQLTVTSTPPRKKKEEIVPQEPVVDTTQMFSRLDALLEEWKKSTSGEQPTPTDTASEVQQAAPSEEKQTGQPFPDPGKKRSFSASDTGKNMLRDIKTCYCIQIAASKSPMPELQDRIVSMGLDLPLHEDFDGEWYRYMLGRFKMLREAINHLEIVRNNGFPDAFIVNYLDGVRSKRIY